MDHRIPLQQRPFVSIEDLFRLSSQLHQVIQQYEDLEARIEAIEAGLLRLNTTVQPLLALYSQSSQTEMLEKEQQVILRDCERV